MEVGTALGGTGLFVSVAGIIYSAINHKHIKSTCCGRNFDFSIDIDSTENEAKQREAREKEAKEAREKEGKEAKEKEEKEAKEKEAKEKEAKVGNSKFDDYSIFRLKPRIAPHFNV